MDFPQSPSASFPTKSEPSSQETFANFFFFHEFFNLNFAAKRKFCSNLRLGGVDDDDDVADDDDDDVADADDAEAEVQQHSNSGGKSAP